MGLGVERQPPHEEHHECRLGHAEFSASGIALFGAELEIFGVDAERDDGQLRHHDPGSAEPLAQVAPLAVQQAFDIVLHRLAGADQRVPRLHGGDQKIGDAVHHARRGRGVGDAAETPGTMPEGGTTPSLRAQHRVGLVEHLRLGQIAKIGRGDRAHGLGAPGSPGGARKTLCMRRVADIDEETIGPAMAQEAAQEGLPRRIASHEFGAAGGVRLGVEVDGWFHTPQEMVPGIGFEPTTYALRMRRSTN